MSILSLAALSCNSSASSQLDCGDAPLKVLHSEHFEYRYCEGDVGVDSEVLLDLESHRTVLGKALGLRESELPEHIVYLKDPRRDFRGHYSVDDGTVHVSTVMNEHDLVHAYSVPAWGVAPSLLVEGLASALACNQGEGAGGEWRDLFDFDQHGESAQKGYDVGGRFVAYLVLQYGMPSFRSFYSASIEDQSAAGFEAAFEAVYGVPLDDAWDRALSQPEFCLPEWACSRPVAAAGEEFTLGASWPGANLRTFEVGSAGVHATVQGYGFRPLSCTPPHVSGYVGGTLLVGGEQDLLEDHGNAPYVAWLELAPGRYAATHYTKASSVGPTVVKVDDPEVLLRTKTCGGTTPIPIDGLSTTYVSLDNELAAVDESGSPLPRVVLQGPQGNFRVHWTGTLPTLSFCSSCGDDGCVNLSGYEGDVTLSPALALRPYPGTGFSTFRLSLTE